MARAICIVRGAPLWAAKRWPAACLRLVCIDRPRQLGQFIIGQDGARRNGFRSCARNPFRLAAAAAAKAVRQRPLSTLTWCAPGASLTSCADLTLRRLTRSARAGAGAGREAWPAPGRRLADIQRRPRASAQLARGLACQLGAPMIGAQIKATGVWKVLIVSKRQVDDGNK